MMNQKKCAREECGKTVYPIEEMKYLDRVWHKQCFRCTECSMSLTLKNFKGYDKRPYCEAHCPKTTASVMTDTPEMRRLAENTKIQSSVKYHEDFEKMKGKRIQIADDPEMTRHMKNTLVVSQAAYHNEMDRKKYMDQTRPPLEEAFQKIPGRMLTSDESTLKNGSPYSNRLASQSNVVYSTELGGRAAGSMTNKQSPQKLHQQPPPQQQLKRTSAKGFTVRALYDYTAADTDEVTFVEGDTIVNCESVDDGWMTGTIRRTNKWGMLPANYVERLR